MSEQNKERNQYCVALNQAKQKGWKIPALNDPFPMSAWVHYWNACLDYENNPENGRPVVPHRSA